MLDKDTDPYENSPSPKRTPTPTFGKASDFRAHWAKHPIRPWKERKITGRYTIISCKNDIGHHVDTTGFEVKVFYDCRAEERKIYVTFKFDKLAGIIRLRKHLKWEIEIQRRLTAEEFDEACALPPKEWTSRGHTEYSSRWRGKECGNRNIDGELGHTFEFHKQETRSSSGFPDMKISFNILYDDETFYVRAMKTADLDGTDLQRMDSLERDWKNLRDPRPEAQYKLEFEPLKDDLCCLVRKRVFPENRKRKAEYQPFSNGSRMFQSTPLAVVANTSTKSKSKSKTLGWPVSGVYRLECTNKLNPVDASGYCFELHYLPDSYGQLFAMFEFGTLKGLMRLCPEEEFTSRPDKFLSLDDFEKGCLLETKTRPGTTCKAWLSRWRAIDGDVLKGGETRAQGQFTMKKETAIDCYEKVVVIYFVMVIDGRHLTFEGIQTAPLDPPGPDFDLDVEWLRLCNPSWEAGSSSSVYQPGSIIQIKHKHKPAPATASGPSVVQGRPEWAWDITGEWTLTDSHGLLSSIDLPKTTPLTMSIFLANNPKHKKIQRQYWAIFKFGKTIEGCMRFCMPMEGRSCEKEFEEACMLDDNDWVGPAPNGTQKLQYRWKAKNAWGYTPSWALQESLESIDFKLGDDGKLMFGAVITANFQPRVLKGTKVAEGAPRKGNAATVKTVWSSYLDLPEPRVHRA